MKNTVRYVIGVAVVMFLVSFSSAAVTTINGFDFDLDQFIGASVTYRPDGSVSFDGKTWDQATGTDGYTLGELAAGQYGSDPGDQVSLNDRSTPDWLQLNYAAPITISSSLHTLVIYEISSYPGYVDLEGVSFNIKLNGGTLIPAAVGIATPFDIPGTEATNQIVFDLYSFGFTDGDYLSTVYIENIDSGSSTSDPDFIFAGVASTAAAVPAPSAILLGGLGVAAVGRIKRISC